MFNFGAGQKRHPENLKLRLVSAIELLNQKISEASSDESKHLSSRSQPALGRACGPTRTEVLQSPFGLIEELLAEKPWQLLAARPKSGLTPATCSKK